MKITRQTALHMVLFSLAMSGAAMAETVGPVTDDIGVVTIEPGEPIVLGGSAALTGTDFTAGIYEQNGMTIAVKRAGEIDGHPLQLISEDGPCTPEGGQTAATKLAANPDIVVVMGPSCSSSGLVGAPILWNVGIPSVGVGTAATNLTAKDRPEGLNGFVRVIPTSLAEASLASKYARDIGLKKVATIHDGSNYAEQFAANFVTEFTAAGGEVTNQEAIAPTDTDMRPVLTRIASNPPDAIVIPVFPAAASFIARQIKELPALANTKLIGTGSLAGVETLNTAGDSITGLVYAGIAVSAFGDVYDKFLEEYVAAYGENPPGGFAAYGYDATVLAIDAIKRVAKTDDSGTTYIGRKALRDALYATKDLQGLSGKLTCSEYGDCGSPDSMVIWEFVSGDPATFDPGKNPKIIYPEKFAN